MNRRTRSMRGANWSHVLGVWQRRRTATLARSRRAEARGGRDASVRFEPLEGRALLSATTLVQWNFEAQNLAPSSEAGTASVVGGISQSFSAGTGGTGTYGWNTTTYAAQGTGSGQRGVQFLVSSAGHENLTFRFDHRASGTASRWAQVDYTVDGGGTWTTGFWNNSGGLSPHDNFYSFTVDFSGVAAANDNPDFGVRVVSIFSPLAFSQNSTTSVGANAGYMRANSDASYAPDPGAGTGTNTYSTAGTWRFDNVTFSGTAIPAGLPTVTTPTSAAVTAGSAQLGGTVERDGFSSLTARGIVLAPDSFTGALTPGTVGVTTIPADSAAVGTFAVAAANLSPGTAYRYRAFATNNAGFTGYSAEGGFTTLASASAPAVGDPTATAITGSAATLGGTVVADGGNPLTGVGIVYSATLAGEALVVGAPGATVVPAALQTGAFTVGVTGLSEVTAYNYRVFATNAEGTSYTPAESFTTAGSATVTTLPTVSGLSSFTATLTGTATAGSAILARGFVLAPTSLSATPVLGGLGVTQLVATAGQGEYSAAAARLSSLTGYSFRAYATTAAGTFYGDVATFATLEGPIVQWDFEGDVLAPIGGSGTAALVGGTTANFGPGTAGGLTAGRAWNTTTYASQEQASGQRGVEFRFSTVGYKDVSFSYDHRASGTASRWARVDYTLDGATWTVGSWNNGGGLSPHDNFYSFTVDLGGITGANDNPDFGVRIVSIFSPQAFDQNNLLSPYAAQKAYMRANANAVYSPNESSATGDYGTTGTWRFDNVTVTGTALTAQAPTVTVAEPTVVKGASATLGGVVVGSGGRDVTTRGVLVAAADFAGVLELGVPGVTRFDAAAGGLGEFTATAEGLELATTYVYRAFAINIDGVVGYSGTLEFTTIETALVATAITLDTFGTPVPFGTPVAFTGSVTAVGSEATPVGTVQIRSGGPSGTVLASAAVGPGGTFTATATSLAIGTYSGIAAYFLGNDTFDETSAAATVTTLEVTPRAFTPGNLLVVRVGDGTTALGTAAGTVTLVEFTPGGTLVQEIPVAAAGDAAFTLRADSVNEGILSLAADRQTVTLGGYRAAAGAANPVASNVARVIGSVGPDGGIDTSRAFTGVFTNEPLRSVTTDDGSNFWLAGAGLNNSGGVRYVAADGTDLIGLLTAPPSNPNMRQVLVLDGNLFVASGSEGTGRSVYQVGTGLPTEEGQELVNLLPTGGAQWHSFYFADLDPAVSWGNTGFDTLYVTDSAAVTKFSYVAGDAELSWQSRGSVILAGASGLTGFTGGNGAVTLYVTSATAGTGGIATIVDTSGAGGTFSAPAANINVAMPVTAGTNFAFRGIAFVPRAGIDTTTTITAISSAVTEEFLQEVTFSATVAAASGATAPTGVVQFRSGNVLVAAAPLSGSSATASATIATTALPFGRYSGITARFIPDGNASANLFNPSVSAAFGEDLVVEPQGAVTTTLLTGISALAVSYGDVITFTGTVTGDGEGLPIGTVQIRAGGPAGTLLAAADVIAGAFSIATDTLVGGIYEGIVAVFTGVPGFQNSVSTAFAGTLEVAFTQLGLGDIAFMGYQPAAPDAVSFVLLRDVIAGTTLTITDKPWSGAALGSGEGTSTITFTQAFSAGEVFEYLEYDFEAGDIDGERWARVTPGGFSVDGLFDVTTSNFGMSTAGDNLFAYQGAAPTSGSASNWIAGFSTRPFLTEGATTTQTSYLPEALASRNAAFSLDLAADDPAGQGRRLADFGTVTGTRAEIRALLADPANWVVTTSSYDGFRSETVFVVTTRVITHGQETITDSNLEVDEVSGSAAVTIDATGVTIVEMSGGTVQVNETGTTVSQLSAGTLQVNADSTVVAAVSGSPTIEVADGVVVEIRSGSTSGEISGEGGVLKTGAGVLVLAGDNTYVGPTVVASGTLVVTGSTGTGPVTVESGAVIGGTGTIAGPLSLSEDARLSPGTSPGTITLLDNFLAEGGAGITWELLDATGSAGSGWDFISSSGSFTLVGANPGTPFVVSVVTLASTGPDVRGNALNFNPEQNYSWLLGTFAEGISGFTAGGIVVDTTAFANPYDTEIGSFSVRQSGTSLFVDYTYSAATPTIDTSGSLSGVSTTYGTASGTTTITVTGSSLAGSITATAPAGFEVSSNGSSFGSTATFTPSSGSVNGTLTVRLAATTNAGTYAGDVSFTSTGATTVTASLPASTVSPKGLTITGLSVATKTYDGTTAATLSGTAALFGVIGSDDVSLSGTGSGTFNSANVNAANAVSVTGFALLGAKAANYTLTQPTLSASIQAKALTVRADNQTRVVNTANPTLTATIMGFVNGETAATAVTGAAALSTTAVQGSPAGSYPITVGVGTLAATNGNYTFTTLVDGTLSVTNTPVKVTGLFVRGSGWNLNYLNLAPFTTVAGSQLGWQLRDGENQLVTSGSNAAQVTWNNVNVISVRFDQAITSPQAAALQLILGTGNQTITPSSVTLLAGGTVAQFVLPSAMVSGKYMISIAATGIMDAAGTTVLDGEWTTSSSTFASGSGNGAAGGMFNFAFNVLVGDVNANGTRNSSDVNALRPLVTSAFGVAPTAGNFRYDLNGNNLINNSDVTALRNLIASAFGTGIAGLTAATAPSPSLAVIGSPTFTNVTATGVRLGATVTSTGGEPVLERGVVVLAGELGTPDATDPAAITILSVGGTGTFSVDVTGLAASTPYRFRAFVRTSQGIIYSEIGSFTTTSV